MSELSVVRVDGKRLTDGDSQLCKIFWIWRYRAYLTLPSFNLSERVLKIATAFIHLLSPGLDALTRPCLSDAWRAYVNHNMLISY